MSTGTRTRTFFALLVFAYLHGYYRASGFGSVSPFVFILRTTNHDKQWGWMP